MTFPVPFSTVPFSGTEDEGALVVPENILLLSPRLSDLATLSASSEVPSLPVRNLQNQEPSKVWRTNSALAQYVDIELPSPAILDAVAMTFPPGGFSAGGQWRLKAWASAVAIGSDPAPLDSGWQSVWPLGFQHGSPAWGPEVSLLRVDNDAAYRYWRVEFTDAGSTAGYLDISRLALSAAVQFSINFDGDQGGIGFVPIDVVEPNGYGQTFTDPRPYAQRSFDLSWSALGHTEVVRDAMELSRLRGQAGDVFVFLDPAEVAQFHLYSMQALFTGTAKYSVRPVWIVDADGIARQAWGFPLSLIQKL